MPATVEITMLPPVIVEITGADGAAQTVEAPARPIVDIIAGEGPSVQAVQGIAEEAATRERDAPLVLIEALLNPGL